MSVLGFAVLKGRPDYDGVMTGAMLLTMPKCMIVCAGMRCVGLLGHDGCWQAPAHGELLRLLQMSHGVTRVLVDMFLAV